MKFAIECRVAEDGEWVPWTKRPYRSADVAYRRLASLRKRFPLQDWRVVERGAA